MLAAWTSSWRRRILAVSKTANTQNIFAIETARVDTKKGRVDKCGQDHDLNDKLIQFFRYGLHVFMTQGGCRRNSINSCNGYLRLEIARLALV